MHSVIESKRAEVTEICRRFHVRRLDLFGSATGGDFNTYRSDVDLLVEFGVDSNLMAFHQYFGLREALATLFDRPMDLIVASGVKNPYIWRSIEATRENLYAA